MQDPKVTLYKPCKMLPAFVAKIQVFYQKQLLLVKSQENDEKCLMSFGRLEQEEKASLAKPSSNLNIEFQTMSLDE